MLAISALGRKKDQNVGVNMCCTLRYGGGEEVGRENIQSGLRMKLGSSIEKVTQNPLLCRVSKRYKKIKSLAALDTRKG